MSLSFATSNARVTPLCLISISHLELMGAVIGKKLALSITDILGIDKELITFWTDSMFYGD